MEFVWYAAACFFGLALGLHFGRLLTAVILRWESTAVAVKFSMGLVGFMLGAGGGAAIFKFFSGMDQAGFYILFLGVGMTIAFFQPNLPDQYTLKSVGYVVRMSEALREMVPDVEQRVLLIITPFTTRTEEIQKQAKISEQELEARLEDAADAMADDDGGDGASDHGK